MTKPLFKFNTLAALVPAISLAAMLLACGNDSVSPGLPDSESTDNFVNEDVSSVNFAFDSSPNFKMDNGAIHISSEDGSASKSVRNWVLSANYTHFVASGFAANIKVGSNMNFAGVELFKKNSYDDYRFQVYADGKFVIRDPETNILKLPADSSFIRTGGYNRIVVQTTDAGNVQVYVNSHLVKTIQKSELAFKLTETDKIAVCYNVQSSASESSPAEAWVKFETMQSAK